MPIYEFKCSKCNEIFEVIVMSGNDDEEIKCTKCGSQSFERVLSSGSIGASNPSPSGSGVSCQERKCSSGSCSTYTIPGPA